MPEKSEIPARMKFASAPMTINQKLDELFDVWEKKYRDSSGIFVRDGIIEEANYKNPKILFLLKERNLNGRVRASEPLERQKDMRLMCQFGPWPVLGQWAYGLRKVADGEAPIFEDAKREYANACKSAAIMNLKKIAGDERADSVEIKAAAEADKEFIAKELNIIQPDIIVCGGLEKPSVFEIAKGTIPELAETNLEKNIGCDKKGRVGLHPI